MEEPIRDADAARRLARTIVSDLVMYHKKDVEQGIVEDNLFLALSEQIEEGREHYRQRVDPEMLRLGLFEKALVDFLFKPFGHIQSVIW